MEAVKTFGRETFSSLKIRNYRLYFIGQAISLCGTWMQTIGQAWLVLKITGSGTALGLITALQFLPILILGPWGGVIADRFSKRKLLYFTQSAAGLLALILGSLILTGTVRLWMVDILAVCLGLVNTIDNPTRQTFLPEMVGEEHLPNAVSLNSTQINLTRVIGPAIAGALIAAAGLASCFMINAISYLAVLVALFMMKGAELQAAPIASKMKGKLKEGFKYVWSNKILRDTLLMMAIIGTLSYEFTVVLPLLAQFTFHRGAGGYAALTAAMGLGSVVGGLFTANRKKISPSLIIGAALLFGFAMLVAAASPNLFWAMLALALVGVFSINFLNLGNVTLQLESSPEMRGRVMSLWAVAFLGSTPIGGPIIGWISEHLGPRWGLATGGFAAILAAGLGAAALMKSQRQLIPLEVKNTAAIETEEDTRIR